LREEKRVDVGKGQSYRQVLDSGFRRNDDIPVLAGIQENRP